MKANGILSKIEKLQKVTQELGLQNVIAAPVDSFSVHSAELLQLREKLKQEKFYLVVIGLFKRGKSSLVNALVKKEVVPYSVIPLTSIVTLLEYAENDYAKIFFYNKPTETFNIETIPEYVTETENPLNKKNVSYVHVFIKSDFLKKVTLVDTPGIGSTFENNTETTLGFVERIDAALFILSADLPISKTEVEFLTKLRSTVPKIIFVLNKTDLVKNKETERIISFNKTVLKKTLGNDSVNIIPVSAKLAIDGNQNNHEELLTKSGLNNLLDEIEKMLAVNKHDVIAASANNQFNSLHHKTETLLNIQLNALLTPIEELNKNYEKFLNSLEIMKKDKGDFEILINGKVKQLQEYVTVTLYEFAGTLYENFCREVDENTSEFYNKLKSSGVNPVYNEYFDRIEQSYEPLKLKLETEIVDRFHNILIEYSQGSNRFVNELVKNFSSISLFEFTELVEKFDLKIITVFYFLFDKSYNPFYLSNSMLRNISIPLFYKKILERMKESFKRNIDMSTGRINYDINYKIQESFKKFTFDFSNKIEDTLNMLGKIIADTINKKEQAEDSISKQVEYLYNKLEELKSIINENKN